MKSFKLKIQDSNPKFNFTIIYNGKDGAVNIKTNKEIICQRLQYFNQKQNELNLIDNFTINDIYETDIFKSFIDSIQSSEILINENNYSKYYELSCKYGYMDLQKQIESIKQDQGQDDQINNTNENDQREPTSTSSNEEQSKISKLEEMMNQLILKEQENEKKILHQEQLIEQLQTSNKLLNKQIEKYIEMQIIIRYSNHSSDIIINIKSTDKLSKIFQKINEDESKCDLSYLGLILDPYLTLEDYTIPNHSIIYIVSKNNDNIVIFIKKNSHDFIPISIESTKTIGKIYKILSKYHSIELDQHNLVFKGKKLVDKNEEICNYSIENYSTIEISPSIEREVLIYYNLFRSETKKIRVKLSDSIQNVKKRIIDDDDIYSRDIILIYNGEQLDDEKKISDYSISDLSTIFFQISEKTLNINIYSNENTYFFYNYDANNKVIDVKKKIQEEYGIQIEEQRLFYRNEEELLDYRSLKFYSFSCCYTCISLYRVSKTESLINVRLETNGGDYECKIVASPTVLIKDIKKWLDERKVIPTFCAVFMFNGKVLDDEKTFQDYNIPVQPEIKLVFNVNFKYNLDDTMGIFVKPLNGNCIYVRFGRDDLVDDLKNFLMTTLKVPYYNMRLYCEGKNLVNGTKLVDYIFRQNQTIILSSRYTMINY